MHLTRIRLGGVPPFTEPIDLKFDPQVNVFIGPNASGKSMLIMMLIDQFALMKRGRKPISSGGTYTRLKMCMEREFSELVGSALPDGTPRNLLSVSADWNIPEPERVLPKYRPPVVYISSVREELPPVSDPIDPYEESLMSPLRYVTDEPFSSLQTVQATEMLLKQFSDDSDPSSLQKSVALLEAIWLADSCSKRICNEVIVNSQPKDYIYGFDFAGHPNQDILSELFEAHSKRLMGIDTTDTRNFDNIFSFEKPLTSAYAEDGGAVPIYLGHLSSGTASTLLWIRWISLKMAYYYDFEEGWQDKPAILLIDEIENHLHPTWQRRVIPALLDHFPGLQIFATTHSPFVVAGLKAGQVHVLKRDANGVVTASTEQRDVIGWTADEILRGMMGVDDPTDDATATAARELRQLRQEGPRVDEKAEEERQQRMLELRGLVDRDLLAGGPMAAQRELFEQQFAEALENYRRSQDLGQESH